MHHNIYKNNLFWDNQVIEYGKHTQMINILNSVIIYLTKAKDIALSNSL